MNPEKKKKKKKKDRERGGPKKFMGMNDSIKEFNVYETSKDGHERWREKLEQIQAIAHVYCPCSYNNKNKNKKIFGG